MTFRASGFAVDQGPATGIRWPPPHSLLYSVSIF